MPTSHYPSSPKTLLIVDDNPTNLGVIADYLEDSGFAILIARDGESGVDKAMYALPDLILLDVMMPGIDGFETCRRLKSHETTKNIPVIFMTALSETEHKLDGFRAGAVDYVTKPLQQEEVLARITTHLQLRELTEQLEHKVWERTNELREAYGRLAKLDQAKSEFIQVTSHELRTPLAIIDGFTHLLKDEPGVIENATAQLYIDHILRGSHRLLDLLENILDVSRVDNALINPVYTQVNLYVLLELVCQRFEAASTTRNISLIRDSALQTLPIIEGDEELLSKAFYHLIVNAIKYTPDGGCVTVNGRFLPASTDTPEQVEIVVTDTGIGIGLDEQPLIFEKFYQTGEVALHSSGQTNFKGGGSGLGLTIVRGAILGHHGQIWVESAGYDEETCPGSQFYIRLPVTRPMP